MNVVKEKIKKVASKACYCGWEGVVAVVKHGDNFSVVHTPCIGVMGEVNGKEKEVRKAVESLREEGWNIRYNS